MPRALSSLVLKFQISSSLALESHVKIGVGHWQIEVPKFPFSHLYELQSPRLAGIKRFGPWRKQWKFIEDTQIIRYVSPKILRATTLKAPKG